MTYWLISADSKTYNYEKSFVDYDFIDWRQGDTKFEIGDIVYIYCTKPISAVRYQCIVEKVNLLSSDIRDDKHYWENLTKYENSLNGKFVRLKLLNHMDKPSLGLNDLIKNGLNSAPQGRVKLVSALEEYLNEQFLIATEEPTTIFAEEVHVDDAIFEGAKTNISVNKYERSSLARQKCIDFHGVNCAVCDMNFRDVYGEIGNGFIHVHHKFPIHKVGAEYQIDYKNDLVPVCPNCHSMLHQKVNGREISIDELREVYLQRKQLK